MLQKLGLKAPWMLGVAFILYGVAGLLSDDMGMEVAGEKILFGLSLCGIHLSLKNRPGSPTPPAPPAVK